MKERNDPDPKPEQQPSETGDQAGSHKSADQHADKTPEKAPEKNPMKVPQPGQSGPVDQKLRRRRRRRPSPDAGLERISQVHYCRTDAEANQYLALGPEWDLQDIIPMRVETEDGGERDEVHFIVARWENERDRARLRKRDRRGVPRRPRQ